MSGVGQRRFHVPDIGIRALQGHSRDDVSLVQPSRAQELLNYNARSLPEYRAHGTTERAWTELLEGTQSIMRGGPKRVRQAVHFAVSLPGDKRKMLLDVKAGSRIYILFDLHLWLRQGRPTYRSKNNVICVYKDIPMSYFRNVINKRLDKELLTDTTNFSPVKMCAT